MSNWKPLIVVKMKKNFNDKLMKSNLIPPPLQHLPKQIITINGLSYYKIDYDCEEAKKMDLKAIQKIYYLVKDNAI